MNSAFRQIGNAVPPLLALAVARTLKQIMQNATVTVLDDRRRQAA
jgi:DNA (cytosine-5)-methyltransferase 1